MLEKTFPGSENWYKTIIEQAGDAFYLSRFEDASLLEVNETACRHLGYTKDELLKLLVTDIDVKIPSFDDLRELWKKNLDNKNFVIESLHRRKDGSTFPVEIRISTIDINNEKCLMGFARDITDRKLIENELLKLQFSVENANYGIMQVGSSGEIIYMNSYYRKVLGYKKEEVPQLFISDIDYNHNLETWKKHRELLKDSGSMIFESLHKRKDGTFFPVEVRNTFQPSETGGFSVSFVTDISKRKEFENAIVKNQKLLNEAQKIAQLGYYSFDVHLMIWENSEMLDRILGIDKSYKRDVAGWLNLIHPQHKTELESYIKEKVYTKNKLFNYEYKIVRFSDAGEAWVHHLGELVFDETNKLVEIVGTVQDITDRKNAENRLLKTQMSIDKAREAVFWIKSDASFFYVNDAACNSLGYTKEELLNMTVFDIDPDFNSERWPAQWEKTKRLKSYVLETNHKTKDGKLIPVEITINFTSFEGEEFHSAYAHDISERKKAENEILKNQRLLKESQKIARLGHYTFDLKLGKWESSDTLDDIFGINTDFSKDVKGWLTLVHPEETEILSEYLLDYVIKNKNQFNHEYRIVRNCDSEVRWVHGLGELTYNTLGQPVFMIGTIQDITERKIVSLALEESEKRLSEAQRIAKMGNWEWNVVEDKLFWSDEVFRIFGVEKNNSVLNYDFYIRWVHPQDREKVRQAVERAFTEPKSFSLDHKIIVQDGTVKTIKLEIETDTSWDNTPQRFYGTVQDITSEKKAEAELINSLKEKEVLIKELYHRTKNNMQVIRSILALRAFQSRSEEVKTVFKDTENRINSMALVHQKLYQSQNLSSINLKDYIEELAPLVFESYSCDPDQIKMVFDLQNVEVLIDIAIPCGLVINELLSNSFKYAFPDKRKGEISIRLNKKEENILHLSIQDNGIGVSKGFDFRNQETLGLISVINIIEHQLQGKINFVNCEGLHCNIEFNDTLYTKRI